MSTDLGRVSEGASQATGLGSAKAPEPSGLGPTGAIPSARNEELRSCPFCGSEAQAIAKLNVVACSNAHCRATVRWVAYEDIEHAFAAWNRRVERSGIDPALAGYDPRLYRGFTITHESDGYHRVYSGGTERGYAQSRREAEALVDKFLAKRGDDHHGDMVERVARAVKFARLERQSPGWGHIYCDVVPLTRNELADATAALEASHHAELVEALRSIRNAAEIAEREVPDGFRAEWASVGIAADATLAKIGGAS